MTPGDFLLILALLAVILVAEKRGWTEIDS